MPSAEFASGAIAMGFAVCAIFFLRSWRLNRDTFSLVFSIAFLLLALNQSLGSLLGLPLKERRNAVGSTC